MTAQTIKRELSRYANPAKATVLMRFFRTQPGDYGAGDRFLGITVPQQRLVAKKFADLPDREALVLLHSPFHEHRLTALIILGNKYARAVRAGQPKVAKRLGRQLYRHRGHINNWDLVDTVAPQALGPYLLEHDHQLLNRLVRSSNVWDRRIAVLSTFPAIRRGEMTDIFRLAKLLLNDQHDLIHKAVGWMLREAGKRDRLGLETFLQQHASRMPRTMLRYAIEKFPAPKRRKYLNNARLHS